MTSQINQKYPIQTDLQTASRSLVFIDKGLENNEFLASAITGPKIFLNSHQDGIEQITAELEKYSQIYGKLDAIYIFSHGDNGRLNLGNTQLTSTTLENYSQPLQTWQNYLSEKADILLYGCNVAADVEGKSFISKFSQMTAADIAASEDLTGNSKLGGDWNLEFSQGQIDSQNPFIPENLNTYHGLLVTRIVTNNADSGAGSLRQIIADAQAGDTIVFDSSLAGATITLTTGQLLINKNLIIDGSAAPNLTISGNNSSRVIKTESFTNITLKNLIVANGKLSATSDEATGAGAGIQTGSNSILTLENCEINNNIAGISAGLHTGWRSTTTVINSSFDNNDGSLATNTERGGGAIGVKSGSTLTVKGSTFTNNKGSFGGAINNLLSGLTIEDSTFKNNTSISSGSDKGVGGAIYVDGASEYTNDGIGGNIIIRNSIFDSNTAQGEGGAGFLFGYPPDKIFLENSTFINNKAIPYTNGTGGSGGGIRAGNGDITVTNSSFINNDASDSGGGLWLGESSNVSITNTTFSGNKAAVNGAGILLNTRPAFATNIVNTTFANNSSGAYGGAITTYSDLTTPPVTVKNSIFANNTAGNQWKIQQQSNRLLIDGGGNIQWPPKLTNDINDRNVTSSITLVAPQIGPLQQINGQYVHPLLAGSPAIDRGTINGAPATDQLGQSRSQDGDGNGISQIDSGAYELPGKTPEILVLDSNINVADGSAVSLGSTALNSALTKTFTLQNTGNAALLLSNLQLPQGYSVVGTLPSTIPALGQAFLTLQLPATVAGSFNGEVSFSTNDSDENLFNFSISATVSNPPTPTPEPAPSPTPEPVPTPTPEPVPSPTPEPVPTPTPEPAPSPTPEPVPTPTPEPVPTPTPEPAPSPTPEPVPTPTPEPAPSPTPEPAPSPTPEPVPTPTPEPAPSPTPEPVPTPTPEPAPSPTPEPAPSPTPEPVPTPTPEPAPSPTPEPVPTPTPEPVPTPTPEPAPSPTPEPVPTPTPEPAPSPTPEPTVDSNCLCEQIPNPTSNPTPIETTHNGTDENDILTGTEDSETFNAKGGDDIIVGMEATDNIYGGNDNDLLFGNIGDDFLDGGEGNDIIYGGQNNDFLQDDLGDDILLGDFGNDTLMSGEGNDLLYGIFGSDFMDGGAGNDTMFGGEDGDIIKGNFGEDIILGDIGDDTLCGGENNDFLFGNIGADLIDGCEGDDWIYGGKDNDTLMGNIGNDFLKGDMQNDLLYGNIGNDTVNGDQGDDTLYGGEGNDLVSGGAGADLIMGDAGNDTLSGNDGNDRFVLRAGFGTDTITDFEKGQDLIVLGESLSFNHLEFISDANNTLIKNSATGETLASLTGSFSTPLSSADFIAL